MDKVLDAMDDDVASKGHHGSSIMSFISDQIPTLATGLGGALGARFGNPASGAMWGTMAGEAVQSLISKYT
jgi:hypothetical protein